MKNKIVIFATVAAVVLSVLVVLFYPFQIHVCNDGGTKEYIALTYRAVHWRRFTGDGEYEQIRVYFFDDMSKSLSELWAREEPYVEHRFVGKVAELNGSTVLVVPEHYEEESHSAGSISFDISNLKDFGAKVEDMVLVTYRGAIRETSPASIDAVKWEPATDLRHMAFRGEWLDKESAEPFIDYDREMKITRIYSDCFFANEISPHYTEFKINGTLGDEWCVGDRVNVSFENLVRDSSGHIEGDLKAITQATRKPGITYDKPVIYLYPEEELEVSVRLTLDGKLTCAYPAYGDGWNVTTQPDGTLTDAKGQTYNYLYWEGESHAQYDLSEGFCVKGGDTAAFLEDALEKLGLTRREANEFIVYWLPLMEGNPYNIISFQTDCYTDAARLEITPAPDTLIRVFMTWKATDTFTDLPGQELTAPQRTGFTVVEWGGTEIE